MVNALVALIVEDDPNMRILLDRYMKSITDQERKLFPNGEELLAWLAELETETKHDIDVILMDIQLPGADGIRLTEKIKQDSLFENLPVLAITGFDDLQKLEEAFDVGCTDYLTKPLNKVEFRARVESALRLKEALDRERELANRDGLTGLYNRRYFNEQIKKEHDRAQRNQNRISFILCDIDCFKQYNDTYGHSAGDEALVDVADVLKEHARRPGDLVARYGGEEFALIMPETDREGARDRATTILEAVEDLGIEHKTNKVADTLTMSVGYSTNVPSGSDTPLNLINDADEGLYQAKEEGRNRAIFNKSA